MLNLNEIEPKGLLVDLDVSAKNATVLKHGVWGDIVKTHALHGALMGSISTMVAIDLNTAVLDLTIQEQNTIVRYVWEHSGHSLTYAMTLAVYQSHESELIQSVQEILDYASTGL